MKDKNFILPLTELWLWKDPIHLSVDNLKYQGYGEVQLWNSLYSASQTKSVQRSPAYKTETRRAAFSYAIQAIPVNSYGQPHIPQQCLVFITGSAYRCSTFHCTPQKLNINRNFPFITTSAPLETFIKKPSALSLQPLDSSASKESSSFRLGVTASTSSSPYVASPPETQHLVFCLAC